MPSFATSGLPGEAIAKSEAAAFDSSSDEIPAELRSAKSILTVAEDFLVQQPLGPKIVEAIEMRMASVSGEIAKLESSGAIIPQTADGSDNKQIDRFQALNSSVKQLRSSLKKSTPGPWILLHIFLIMLTMQWWATWYPGAEPGGGGYVVQRMASCKDERNSVLATLWYQIAHYCVRPWPWIMISFVALALYPELRANYIADDAYDPGIGFPMVMRELCTPGLAGLMLVAFFAAFMSTISTQMNWGASYLVRDFIQPIFMKGLQRTGTGELLRESPRW